MNEKKLVVACMGVLTAELPRCLLYKVADRFTGGRPDLEVAWAQSTTYIEFKYLEKDETVHDKWEDGRQLVTCARLEETTGHCWVVAYQKADKRTERPDQTLVYRPTALLNKKIPNPIGHDTLMDASTIWEHGVIQLRGFDHRAIARLIKQTHG